VVECREGGAYLGEESGRREYDTCREDLSDDHQYTTNIGHVGRRDKAGRSRHLLVTKLLWLRM
jgi:hypothetical protein